MVMDTTLRTTDINDDALRTLGTQIYTLLGETSLNIKCTLKNNRLVVLGEHAGDPPLDSAILLDRLERNIQALQLQFTQHIRLYLRQIGHHQPYAYRQFIVAPPPPPLLNKKLGQPSEEQWVQKTSSSEKLLVADDAVFHASHSLDDPSSPLAPSSFIPPELPQPVSAIDEQPWIVGDAELDVLVNQLTALDPLEAWELMPEDDHQDEFSEDRRSPSSLISESGQPQESRDAAIYPSENDLQCAIEAIAPIEEGCSTVVGSTPDAIVPVSETSVPSSADALEIDPNDREAPDAAAGFLDASDNGTEAFPEGEALLDNGLIPNATELVFSPAKSHSASDLPAESEIDGVREIDAAPNTAGPTSLTSLSQTTDLFQSQSVSEEPPQHPLPSVSPPTITTDSSSIVVAEAEDLSSQPGFHSFTYETSQRLKELSQSLLHPRPKNSLENTDPQQPPATAHLENNGYRRMAIATVGLASLGLAAGIYGATRPCVLGGCAALQEADQLGDKSQRLMQQSQTWADIEATIPPLNQALEILEPIPVWSSHSAVAQQQRDTYALHLSQIHQILDVEQAIKHANQLANQTVYSFEDLQTVRSLWQSAIDDLDLLPIDSPLHDFAQTHLATYYPQLTQVEQQLQQEEAAQATLETAKEAAQLAQVRQGVAQSLENWQFARVTWLVALNRLTQVGEGTLASKEAERLLDFYQTSLNEVNRHVNREQVASQSLEKAKQHAQIATAAEQRHDWKQAISDWKSAIQYTQDIDSHSTYYLKAEGLLNDYQEAVSQVQDKLQAKTLIEGELKQSCIGELQLCHIVSIDQSIKLELDESYMDAISTARGNGNYNLQAVVTDHQLMVRQSLDRIANNFDLPIEVYNPDGGLLERHIPKPH